MEHLYTFFGMSTVSVLHSLLPTHWLPFSVVGRAHGWTLGKTLLITAAGGTCHVISTTLLGWTAATMANAVFSEETIHMMVGAPPDSRVFHGELSFKPCYYSRVVWFSLLLLTYTRLTRVPTVSFVARTTEKSE
eukprot:744102-Prorocentrum_minimum.AAC.1